MRNVQVIWGLEDDPESNVRYLLDHCDVSVQEVDEVLLDSRTVILIGREFGERIAVGSTATGRQLAVVFEHVLDDPWMVYPFDVLS